MNIINNPIKSDNFFKEEIKKTQIYLHHTVSSNAKGSISWWDQDGKPIATAYVIDKDGTIYQTFDPKYWSFHLGLKYGPSRGFADKKSIGIEIVNEGGLKKISDKNFMWNDGKSKYVGKVITLEKPWRGYQYFAAYTDQQVNAVAELLKYLIPKFNIEKKVLESYDFNTNYALNYKGILSHCNVREDKSDISPAFPLLSLQNLL